MKILLLVNYFIPEIGSAADLFYRLGTVLVKRGHQVTVVTTFPRKFNIPKKTSYKPVSVKSSGLLRVEFFEGLRVIRVPLINTNRDNLVLRGIEQVLQPFIMMLGLSLIKRQDAVLVYSPPLFTSITGLMAAKLKRGVMVLNVQDIYPQAVIDLGFLRNKLLIKIFQIIESLSYRVSDLITVHSPKTKEYLVEQGVPPLKISVVYNANEVPQFDMMKEVNGFRSIHQLDGKFVVTYVGIMSFSQDLDTIILAAKKVCDLQDVVFLIVGDGPKKRELISLASRLRLINVVFLPFQAGEDYWRLLLASDVCLVSLKGSVVKTPVVPRKMIDIMMAGRPIIANVPLDGDVPYFIAQADCGIAVEPENSDELAEKIVEMRNMPIEERERLGKNGKDYSHKNFSLEKFAEAYESIFYSLARIKHN